MLALYIRLSMAAREKEEKLMMSMLMIDKSSVRCPTPGSPHLLTFSFFTLITEERSYEQVVNNPRFEAFPFDPSVVFCLFLLSLCLSHI
jgi:hypothetical protein